MKKVFVFLFITIVLTFGMAGMANAAAIFSETFDDNSNGWKTDANWQVVDGVYKFSSPVDFTSANESFINFGLIDASDFLTNSYTISYDFRFMNPWVGFQVGMGWKDAADNKLFQLNSKEYNVSMIHRDWSSVDISVDHSTPGFFQYDQWRHVDLLIDSNYATLDIDGITVVEGAITTYDMDFIGFTSWRSNAEFDNLVVAANPVPEPATLLLLGSGLIGMFGWKKREEKDV